MKKNEILKRANTLNVLSAQALFSERSRLLDAVKTLRKAVKFYWEPKEKNRKEFSHMKNLKMDTNHEFIRKILAATEDLESKS